MCFFLDDYKQVACYAIVLACITLAVHGELHAFAYACGDFHFHHFFAIHDTFARTMLALVLDDFSFTVTSGTDGLCLHHAKDALLGTCHATCSVAIRTSLGARVTFCSRAVTMFASDVFLQFELLFYTVGDVF